MFDNSEKIGGEGKIVQIEKANLASEKIIEDLDLQEKILGSNIIYF